MIAPLRPFGRTGESVTTIWRELPQGVVDAGNWLALTITHADLDRKGYDRLHQRLLQLDRMPDLLIIQDVLANDIKAGWPLHRLQQFRDRGACRFFGVEVESPLEAEWIAANAPVHAVILPYRATDMSARYRVFDAAKNAQVALVGRAANAEEAALQLATAELHGTIIPSELDLTAIAPLSSEVVESFWSKYSTDSPEPPKLRGAHPPDEGA